MCIILLWVKRLDNYLIQSSSWVLLLLGVKFSHEILKTLHDIIINAKYVKVQSQRLIIIALYERSRWGLTAYIILITQGLASCSFWIAVVCYFMMLYANCKRFNVFPFNIKSSFCHNITLIQAQLQQYNTRVNN